MLYWLVLAVHVVVCLFLILVVLLQSGKGGDIASAFGGAGTQTVFGPRSASNVLSKTTTWTAAIFMVTSIALVWLSQSGGSGSVVRDRPAKAPVSKPAPATPAAPMPGTPQTPPPAGAPVDAPPAAPAAPQQAPAPAGK